MKIRSKLLLLLLAIALLPLIVGSAVQQLSMYRLGKRLAAGTRTRLIESARHNLQLLVDDHRRVVSRDKTALELAVRIQAREVERRLAAPPPAAPELFFSEEYNDGSHLPKGMAPSEKHYRTGPDGERVPVEVTYEEQVYFVVKDVGKAAIAGDLARLSTMPEVYRLLYSANPESMYWQYTSLECGFHTSYPGHGGYPPEYDPRKRPWYLEAKAAGGLGWIVLPEVSTRTVALTVAMPVYRPDGSFAGVTAIDVPIVDFFKELELPEEWARDAEMVLVFLYDGAPTKKQRLPVIIHKSYQKYGKDWQKPVELQYLNSDDEEPFEALIKDAAEGRAGVRKMRCNGKDALWAYGSSQKDQPFPVVIVPYEKIITPATEAEQYVLRKTVEGLQIAGVGLIVVILVVAFAALRSSRSVTRPVMRLAEASRKLAEGDFGTRVDIQTGDELQELGDVFNDTGPKLRERERMKQSLDLAMQVQQHLLPGESPRLEGFDIAGYSVYCEETGGDYYDFIELVDLGPGKLGIAVGDITGHGIAAALLVASARGVLRSHAGRHGTDLSELFRALNTHLVRDTGDERFMTLFYCILDTETRSLNWTSGGHDPALLLRHRDNKAEELGSTGIPLGIIEETSFDQGRPVDLESGDVVIIGTDGIWEAHNAAGEMFGRARFCDVLSASADKTATEIYNAIVDAVNNFRAGRPQEDDITLVVIKAL